MTTTTIQQVLDVIDKAIQYESLRQMEFAVCSTKAASRSLAFGEFAIPRFKFLPSILFGCGERQATATPISAFVIWRVIDARFFESTCENVQVSRCFCVVRAMRTSERDRTAQGVCFTKYSDNKRSVDAVSG